MYYGKLHMGKSLWIFVSQIFCWMNEWILLVSNSWWQASIIQAACKFRGGGGGGDGAKQQKAAATQVGFRV